MALGMMTGGLDKSKDRERKRQADLSAARLGMVKPMAQESESQAGLGMMKRPESLPESQAGLGMLSKESISQGDSGKPFGLSITPTPEKPPISDFMKSTKPADGERFDFSAPNAPSRSYSERQEREALIKHASTPYKGSQNGQLTIGQMNILAGLQDNDDKRKNDVYKSQLGAANNLAQTQMQEGSENARTALKTAAGENQFNRQLGFDTEKFQSAKDVEQQKLGLDAQKLQGSLALGKYNADTSRMNSETQQLALQKKSQPTQSQLNERIADYKNKTDSIDSAIGLASGMLENEDGLRGNAGLLDTYTPNFKQDTRKFNSDRKALLSQAYLANSDLLKGVLTDRDAEELKNSFGNLQDTTISDEDYAANLGTFRTLLGKMRENTDTRYQDVVPYMQDEATQGNTKADDKKARIQEYGNKHFGGSR